MNDLVSDVRLALRALRRRPGFTLAGVVTLALGIGATTAIFGVADVVMIRPFDYPEPDRVVHLLGYREGRPLDPERAPISFPNFYDIRATNTVFDVVAAYDEYEATLLGEGEPERLRGATVTAEFFDVLGVTPAVGRFFVPDENVPGPTASVVLSHGLWQRRFGGRAAVIGRSIELNGVDLTVVGVAPADLEDPDLSGARWGAPELWRATPPWFDPAEQPRGGQAFTAIARLKPDVSLEQAQAEVSTIMARLEREHADVMPLQRIRVVPLTDRIVGPVRPALAALLGAVALLLLIACANQTGLLLTRAEARGRELAVRAALGASRGRIVRHLVVESVIIALLGGMLGVALAVWGTEFARVMGAAQLPRADRIAVDARVLGFAALVSLLTGIVVGLAPAFGISRDIQAELRGGTRAGSGPRRERLRRGLVAAQVALSVMLLAGAGLVARSLWRLQRVDPGVRAAHVLTFSISPATSRYPDHAAISRLYGSLIERMDALPGVEAVGTVDLLPLGGSFNGMSFRLPDRPAPTPGEGPSAETRVVSPNYFAAMGVRVMRGRGFEAADDADAAPVVVVSGALANRYWPETDPVGRDLEMMGVTWHVVGVVDDVHGFTLDEIPGPQLYLPHAQTPREWMRRNAAITIRSSSDPLSLVPAVRAAVWEIDPTIPITEVRPMRAVVAATTAHARFRAALTGAFAATALLLGAIGVYGVVSYAVSQRTREIGIRMALGASARQVRAAVLRLGMGPVALGVLLGAVGAVGVGRAIASLLFEISPLDPLTLGAAVLVLSLAGVLACWSPTRRAGRIEPMEALRYE